MGINNTLSQLERVKKDLLKSTFENEFEIGRFTKFVTEFFNDPERLSPQEKNKPDGKEYTNHIESCRHVAQYVDKDKNKVIILAVELVNNRSVERARSMQRNFISKILTGSVYDAALVAFYSENEPLWRLSFVKLDYELKPKGKVTEIISPARRYSYLVGKGEFNHTAQKQLLNIFLKENYNPSLNEIEQAFSVEKVTEDFYKEYKEKYKCIKESLDNNNDFNRESKKYGFTSEQFVKKLMGQLAFIYFIQKKGWLGVSVLPKNKELPESDFKQIMYHHGKMGKEVLEKVFKVSDDGMRKIDDNAVEKLSCDEGEVLVNCFKGTVYEEKWGDGLRNFVRKLFEECLKKPDKNFFDDYLEPLFYEAFNKKRGKNDYFSLFNCKIPFLNEGLFEPLEDYDWKNSDFNIPNELFSNIDKDEDAEEGVLDVFDRYNFTINEDEPLEKEVAVDPEMLGVIFEKLLDVEERKSKGAFYTPREIVHYMCQESLINYLVNEVDVPYDDIKEFILHGELISDIDNFISADEQNEKEISEVLLNKINEIDKALDSVRIADPAVGSGAFPLGMLDEITRAKNNITEYIIKKDKEGAFGTVYGEAYIRGGRSRYKIKKDIIKNCIFGVDIEPSAVDIAKLRLWLSLLVEQDINEENPKPQPLPNLDCNIVVGNSLIDEYEGIKLFDESIFKSGIDNKGNNLTQLSFLYDPSDKLIKEMFDLQGKYFDEDDEEKKNDLKEGIYGIRDRLIRCKLQRDGNEEGIKKYEESLKSKMKPYFIWQLEFARAFKEKGGFDIVLGNPPYIGFHNVPNKKRFNEIYFVANGKYDYYVLFIERAVQLLKEKGFLSYICPSYFYMRNYGKNTRKYLLENTTIKYIADFKDYQVFDSALTYTCIFGIEKIKNTSSKLKILGADLKSRDVYLINQSSLKEPAWSLEKNSSYTILEKLIAKSSTTFSNITKSISQGIVTGCNNVFLIEQCVIEAEKIEKTYLKKAYKGKDIKSGNLLNSKQYIFYPYYANDRGKTICINEATLKENSPNLYNYLIRHKDVLLDREYFVKSNKSWFELWNPRKVSHFFNRKFVFAEISMLNDFVIADECFYTDSACGAELLDSYKKYEKYIILYLNSKLATYAYKKLSVPKANGYSIYKNAFLKGLPIINLRLNDLDIEKFDKMSQHDFNNYIYDIVGLTEEEIKIVENV